MARLHSPRVSASTAATIKRSSRPLVTLGNITNGGFSTHFLSILKSVTRGSSGSLAHGSLFPGRPRVAFKLFVAMSRKPLGDGSVLIISGGTNVEGAVSRAQYRTSILRSQGRRTRLPTARNIWDKRFTDSATGADVIGGGARSNMSMVIPLTDGKFKCCFTTTTSGIWPSHPNYGVNLTLQLWGR